MNRCIVALLFVWLGSGPLAQARPEAAAPSQQVPFPCVMRDSAGDIWDIQQDGHVGDQGNIYSAGGALMVGSDNQPWTSAQQQASLDAARNELTLAPEQVGGLSVSRRIYVNAAQNWCRWTEVLDNPSPTPIRTRLQVRFTVGTVADSRKLEDNKSHKQVGVSVFDGNHGIAMIAAGRGGATLPAITLQQNNGTLDFVWNVEVPARQKVAIAHLQVVRPTLEEATAFWDHSAERDLISDIPALLQRALVNFPHSEKLINDTELLRGGMLDVVELHGGDQWRGTLKDPSFHLETSFGPLDLPADQVVGMLTVGSYRPIHLFVTPAGEVFGGTLKADSIRLELSTGQITNIPLRDINRIGWRKRSDEIDDWNFKQPMLFLRDGQRISIIPPGDPIVVSTVYGPLHLKPDCISSITFQGDGLPVHQVELTDGSRFAGLVSADSFELEMRTSALLPHPSTSHHPLNFPTAAIGRLQFGPSLEASEAHPPTLVSSNGDALIGVLSGSIELEAGFDTIRIDGSEVRALGHSDSEEPAGRAGRSPTEIQVTLWDNATLTGRVKSDTVPVALRSGILLRVPVALIDSYTQPEPRPTRQVMDRIKGLISDLGATDWKQRDRAAEQLRSLGPVAAGVLTELRQGQRPEIQKQIETILKSFDEAKKAAEAPKPPPPSENAPAENAAPPAAPQPRDEG